MTLMAPSVGLVAGYAAVGVFVIFVVTLCARSLIRAWVDRPRDLDSTLHDLKKRTDDLEQATEKCVRNLGLDIESLAGRLKKAYGQWARDARPKVEPEKQEADDGLASVAARKGEVNVDPRAGLEQRAALFRKRRT